MSGPGGPLQPKNAKNIYKSKPEPFEWNGYQLTSGDISRLLQVDLKTVHNWVSRGQIQGRRTEGRHLRFARPEVVRFLRQMGQPVPPFLGNAPARLLLDINGTTTGSIAKQLGRGCEVSRCKGLFACSLTVAGGQHEMVVIDLDNYAPRLIEDFVRAVRSWSFTEKVCLVGVTGRNLVRHPFLKLGGDAVLSANGEQSIRQFVRWLVGATAELPAGVLVRPAMA